MNIEKVLSSIKSNNVSSNYLLYGEEHFFIDQIDSQFVKYIIPQSEKIFNEKILYGKDIDVAKLVNLLKSFPMMGERQLILIREAQEMDNISSLIHYLQQPVDSTLLVICYKSKKSRKKQSNINKVDKRNKWVKLFEKNGLLIKCDRIYPNKISYWIRLYVSEKNIQIEKKAELLLTEHLGNNLSKITNAINKLANLIEDSNIKIQDVHQHIGVHRDYNNFELQEALSVKNYLKALSIIHYFSSNSKKFPPQPIIGSLFSFFSKLLIVHSFPSISDTMISSKINVHPYYIIQYRNAYRNYSFKKCLEVINLLKEADLVLKGIKGKSDVNYLEELLLRIMH